MSLRVDVRNMLREYDSDLRNADTGRHIRTEMALMILRRLFSDIVHIPNSDFSVLGELIQGEDLALFYSQEARNQVLVVDVFERALRATQQGFIEKYPHFDLGSPLEELQGWATAMKRISRNPNQDLQSVLDKIINAKPHLPVVGSLARPRAVRF